MLRNLLPNIVATLTRHRRYEVKAGINFQWSNKSWIHNFFRCWELIAGRRYGVRFEASSSVMKVGNKTIVVYSFGTWESLFAHCEGLVRLWFKQKLPRIRLVKVPLLIPVYAGGFVGVDQRGAYVFAIAFDVASGAKAGVAASSLTFSHTITGSNPFLMGTAGSNCTSGVTVTGVTWNTVGMTEVDERQQTAANTNKQTLASYVYNAPGTGTANVVVTYSGNPTGGAEQINAVFQSYSGCAQSGQPDSNGFVAALASSTDPILISTTVVASDCWLAGGIQGNQGELINGSGSAPTVQRGVDQFNQVGMDSNGTVSTGSQSLAWDWTPGSEDYIGLVISIKPPAVGPAGVKTFDGVTQSTGIKTYWGPTTVATTKTVNGVS